MTTSAYDLVEDVAGPSLSHFLTTLVVRFAYLSWISLAVVTISGMYFVIATPASLLPLGVTAAIAAVVLGSLVFHFGEPKLLRGIPAQPDRALPVSLVHMAFFTHLFIITVALAATLAPMPVLLFIALSESITRFWNGRALGIVLVGPILALHFFGTLWPEKTLVVFRKKLVAYPLLLLLVNVLLLLTYCVAARRLIAPAVGLALFSFGASLVFVAFGLRQIRAGRRLREANLFDDYADAQVARPAAFLPNVAFRLLKQGYRTLARLPFSLFVLIGHYRREPRQLADYYKFRVRFLARAEDYEAALASANEALVDLSKKGATSDTVVAWRALALAQTGFTQQARDALAQAVDHEAAALRSGAKARPNAYFRLFLGHVYWLLDDLEMARRLNDEALQIDPQCPFAWVNKARFLCETGLLRHGNDPEKLVSTLSEAHKAVHSVPGRFEHYYAVQATAGFVELLQGAMSVRAGRIDEAAEALYAARVRFVDGVVKESHRFSRLGLALMLMVGTRTYRQAAYHLRRLLAGLGHVGSGHKFRLTVGRNLQRVGAARDEGIQLGYGTILRYLPSDVDLLPVDIRLPKDDVEAIKILEARVFPPGLLTYYWRYAFKY